MSKLLKYVLESIREVELDLSFGGHIATKSTAGPGKLLNKAILEQIEQLTSTVIRASSAAPPEGHQKKVGKLLCRSSLANSALADRILRWP